MCVCVHVHVCMHMCVCRCVCVCVCIYVYVCALQTRQIVSVSERNTPQQLKSKIQEWWRLLSL